jgi:hypothetical protein
MNSANIRTPTAAGITQPGILDAHVVPDRSIPAAAMSAHVKGVSVGNESCVVTMFGPVGFTVTTVDGPAPTFVNVADPPASEHK